MRLIEEHGFVDRFEQNPDRLLNEPVFHRRDTQRSCFAVVLRDINPPDRPEAISAICYPPGDVGELRQRHAVEGLAIYTRRQGSLVARDLFVSPLEEMRRSHQAVKAIYALTRPRQSRQ
ncbi:hypothetical protein [Bradyrhizobium sp. RT9a]|uniref:hypothetical protein n=1 Tax=Bradyrhizobium sp. RT9a TaxID=3156384 RepID=UPI0033945959